MTYIEFKNSRDHFTVDEYANAKTVEELEKLKAEIKFKCRLTCTLVEALQIIDKYIKELKGVKP